MTEKPMDSEPIESTGEYPSPAASEGQTAGPEPKPFNPEKESHKKWEDMDEEERRLALERARAVNETRDHRRRRGFN